MSDYTENGSGNGADQDQYSRDRYDRSRYGDDRFGQSPESPAPESSYIPDVTVGGTFKEAFARFRANFVPILLLLVSVSLPVAIIRVFLIERNFNFGSNYTALLELLANQTADESSVQEAEGLLNKLMLYYGLVLLLSLILTVMTAGMIRLAKQGEYREGDADTDPLKIGFGELFDNAIRLFPKVLLTSVTVGISVFIGLMLCVVPGILVAYIFQFALCAAVFTGLFGRRAGFVSSLCTRKYPRISVITCMLYLLYMALIPNFAVNLLSAAFSAAGLSGTAFDLVNLFLIMVQQLLSGFGALCVACVFTKLYPGIESMLKSAGLIRQEQ